MRHNYISCKSFYNITAQVVLFFAFSLFAFQNLKSQNLVLEDSKLYLSKDKNGIPNAQGLVLLHNETDSFYLNPKSITNLELSPHWELKSFPIEVLNFPNVKTLYIGMRSFEKLPESIVQLSKLESIDFQNSKLKYLPENIGELKELRELILLFSDIETLPVSICDLKNLKRLHLGGTNIQQLPVCLAEMSQLEEFILFYEEGAFSQELKEQLTILEAKLPNCTFYIE